MQRSGGQQLFILFMADKKFHKTKKIVFRPDTSHTKFLMKLGKLSAKRSIKETKALGLPITYLENKKVIREHIDGTKEVIGEI